MAEDFGDKTEAPTPRRREQAREQGNIARSADLTAAAMLLSVMFLLKAFGGELVGALKNIVRDALGAAALSDLGVETMAADLVRCVVLAAVAMVPLMIGLLVIAVSVNLMQVGFFASSKRLKPNLAALNPLKGFKRLFGGGRGFVPFALNVLKLGLVGWVAWSAVAARMPEIITAQQLTFIQIFALGSGIVYSIAVRLGLMLLLLALIDYAWQRYRIERDLRMTKQEVKEEMKQMDGDPKLKQRRRQIQMQQAVGRLRTTVPTADVIVTNPTEFAVALKYDVDAMHAPRVVAKGADFMAMRIREIAIANGIPILERKPLARALFRLVEVGQEIPEQFYAAVAEILAYVYEISGKASRLKQSV